ncbi:MAG: dihydroneopterin triphosphate 2'-epimerase [Hahellaceae bacterium]|nr:dihydroneopterin triphosphate 2'-epimerase [Hahellaceae bacterium]MCP5169382.1 dihydroneopterin triphosphate 2'-epimerase [Hahellaceae bacterium]
MSDPHLQVHSEATIRIKSLRLRTYIGIKDDEISNRQDIIINAVIRYNAMAAVDSNEINSALNYRTITKAIINKVENGHFALLERLTHDVLSLVLSFEGVKEAQVEIDKPYALRYADSVSISLSGSRSE